MFDYTEYVFNEGDSEEAVLKNMKDNGWAVYLTTMHKDREVKSITFRRKST